MRRALRVLDPLLPGLESGRRGDRLRLLGTVVLFFLVLCAVGLLRPVRNAIALDSLGASNFYRTYLVSAVVVLFVVPYTRLADRIPWRILIPAVSALFALVLVGFRLAYRERSPAFGLAFYGWYDLFAAALVTQFFMATQTFFNARNAKAAYPLVIAAGSLGATLGGAVTAFFAGRVGTPNLLLVAAGFMGLFAAGVPLVWGGEEGATRRPGPEGRRGGTLADLRLVAGDAHVRLIAATVLLAVVVKQIVDFEYNVITLEVFGSLDAVSSFQGTVEAATQWLPLVVLAGLGPMLRRWGIGAAIFLLPAFLLAGSFGLAAVGGLWVAVGARAGERSLRYSAERVGREILYVPVPPELKLKAKAYIDMAVEKGLGKGLSGLLILGLASLGATAHLAWVGVGLSALWLAAVAAIRREYVRTLADSIAGRFASLRGVFVSLFDASTHSAVEAALRSDEEVQVAFALDLIEEAEPREIERFHDELEELLDHPSPGIRRRTLEVVARWPEAVEAARVREVLHDPSPAVREAAVVALAADGSGGESGVGDDPRIFSELLAEGSSEVRRATLRVLHREEAPRDGVDPGAAGRLASLEDRAAAGEVGAREELALAAGLLADRDRAARLLAPLLDDDDPVVARAALASAGRLDIPRLRPALLAALADPDTRRAAREALARQGPGALDFLAAALHDEGEEPAVRRQIPPVLAAVPVQASVDCLTERLAVPAGDEALEYRTLTALNRLRARSLPELRFDEPVALMVAEREVDAAHEYRSALRAVRARANGSPGVELLGRALVECLERRREVVFRCLALVFEPAGVYRCYRASAGEDERARANALEWLEATVGHDLYRRLSPVLEGAGAGQPGRERDPADAGPVLRRLASDRDPLVARCAVWCAGELDPPGTAEHLEALARSGEGPVGETAARCLELRRAGRDGAHRSEGDGMDLIEKIFLLQNVDLLRDADSSSQALLASIAEEVQADRGDVLIRKGEPNANLYVVVRGRVELTGVGDQVVTAEEGRAFGTWALIDQDPSLVNARVVEPTRLLRIRRGDFHDLLADHPELAMGLLQGLARRVRSLVA